LFDEAFVLNSTMKNFLLSLYFFSLCNFAFQKQNGIVVDKADQPVPLQT
jgi:hypothetical protein